MLKHHVFLVRNWEKIRQKQEEVKHVSDTIHSTSLYNRWNGICRDDGNIKSGEASACSSGVSFENPCDVPTKSSSELSCKSDAAFLPGPSTRREPQGGCCARVLVCDSRDRHQLAHCSRVFFALGDSAVSSETLHAVFSRMRILYLRSHLLLAGFLCVPPAAPMSLGSW